MGTVVITPTKAAKRQGKRGKHTGGGPARKRYWASRHLERNKIRRMMKAYGLTQEEAKKRWHAERKTRTPTGYISDYSGGKANTHDKDKKAA